MVLEILLYSYVAYITSYMLFFGIGGFLYKKQKETNSSARFNYLILVPGYKEDQVIVETTKKNLLLDFPKSNYRLLVIADSFHPDTLNQLQQLDSEVIEVSFERSTKVRALKKALQQVQESFDYLVVLDADNVMKENYLKIVDSYLQKTKFQAVQTQRSPKNKNNKLAFLDGVSEAINNHIYRLGASSTGFSSALNGSGMVFDFELFKSSINEMDSIGGFDRELEYRLIENGVVVKYLKEAQVLDEKTDSHSTFQNQRKRWISSQYVYLAQYFKKGVYRLFRNGDFIYFHSTIWRNIQLPRLINIGLFTLLLVIAFFMESRLSIPFDIWFATWCIYILTTLISIPRRFYSWELITALTSIPKILLSMVLLMFRLKGANKNFIHTPHKTK